MTLHTMRGFSDQKYLNAIMKEPFHLTAHQYRKIMKDEVHFGIRDFSHSHMLHEFTKKLHQIRDGEKKLDFERS